MTRILLLGASGRTGLLTLAEALSRSYTITALVRRPDSLPPRPNLSIITGTPSNKTDIAAAFASAPASDPIRAVISTLNNGRTSDIPWAKTTAPPTFMADCAQNAVDVMRERGCKKIVWLGTNGVGESRKNAPWFLNFIVDHSNLSLTFADHHATQKILESEAAQDPSFKWVDIRAGGLSNGPRKELKHFGNEGEGFPMLGMISRDSVAKFLVDCVESGEWDGGTPVVTN